VILRKILIANRGEIAVRVIRACRDMGLATVAVYSECDRAARHVRMSDEAIAIGPSPPGESYLRIDRIIDAARASGADAIHPGYGFLSENEDFAAACRDAEITFIGPTAEAITLMGSKTAARRAAIAVGVPVVPGTEEPLSADVPDAVIVERARQIGFPVMVKAVAGGGGKGMRVVENASDLASAIRAARSEAGAAFGDSSIYLERRLERPRHIEVQLLADHHGEVLACVERECSIQRRHQKVIEETPSPVVSSELRARLTAAAAAVAASVGYVNAGTVEFLLDEQGHFYFLEMNTRIQVEHPVTEMVTGVDLVHWQIRIARGERLTAPADQLLTPRGHAIECRVYAEDPDAGFMPSPGLITSLRTPSGPGIRDDGWAETGTEVPVFYDPLISKLVAWGADRSHAIARMRRALMEYEVRGIRTSLPFFQWILRQPAFESAEFHTEFLDELLQRRSGGGFSDIDPSLEEVAAIAACIAETDDAQSGQSERTRPTPRSTTGGAVLSDRPVLSTTVGPVLSDRPERTWKGRARFEGLRG
jgi:acetyl-CoA carboxylase biotin carboxylase subunit